MFNDDTPDWIRTLYQDIYPIAPQYQVGPRNRATRVMASPAQSQPRIQLQQSQPQQMPWQMPQRSMPQPQATNPWQTEVIPAQPGVTDVNKNVLPQPPINPVLQNLQNIRHNINPQPSITRAPVRSVPFMQSTPQAAGDIDRNKIFPKPRNQFMGVPTNQAVSDFRSLSNRGISREDILRFLSSPDYATFRGGQHPSQ